MPTTPRKPFTVSKTKFVAGLQCDKRAYMEEYHRDLKDAPDPTEEDVKMWGIRIGELARDLYPGGELVDISSRKVHQAVSRTQELMADPDVPAIFEAAFQAGEEIVRVDLLIRNEDGTWDLGEVKSSSSMKKEHQYDAAFQYYVLDEIGVDVRNVYLTHINSNYVHGGGDVELEKFFAFEDLTLTAKAMTEAVRSRIQEHHNILEEDDAPAVEVGPHCKSPHKCPFWGHCHRDEPEFSIEQFPRFSAKRREPLVEMGIEDIRDIPMDYKNLTDAQKIIRDVLVSGVPYFDEEGLKEALENIVFPVHFMDFETFAPGIPRYKGTRPYQAIPFQWSNHTLYENGRMYHREYLHADDSDPRERFTKMLLEALEGDGSIVVYSNYEMTTLKRLQEDLPKKYQGPLDDAMTRIVDLHPVIRDNVYLPEFQGSFSLKYVLPAVVENMSYKDLEIQNGAMAASAFIEIIDPETTIARRASLSTALLKYCERDTEGLARLFLRFAPQFELDRTKEEAMKKSRNKRRKSRARSR